MTELRPVVLLISRLSFVVIIGVLMILWIVLAVQTVNEIQQLDEQNKKINQQDRNKYYDQRPFNRVKGMTIFNTLLEEVIAGICVFGVLFTHRYLLHTSVILLSIIWFVAHYRISDLFWYGSSVMIASHVTHFIVVLIGLIFTYYLKDGNYRNEKSSKICNSDTTNIVG